MSRRFTFLKSGASAVAVLASVTSAQAAQTISGPATADPVTNAQTDIVTINLDATIRADATTNDSFFNGLVMSNGTGNLVINDSALLGDIVNTGSMIATTGSAIQIINDSQVFGQVSNSGLISGSALGINLAGDSTIGNGLYNSGTIGAGSTAVLIGDDSELVGGIHNSGQISANVAGISVNDPNAELWGGIHNAASGLIYAGSSAAILLSGGVYDGGITNAGAIHGQTSADGIRMTTGTFTGDIVNTGVIDSTYVSGDAIEISGGTFNGSISNTGSIIADMTSGIAINISGGTFTGDIVNTDDGTNRGRISGGLTAINIANTSFTGNVENSADIVSASGIGVSISTTTFTGDVTNSEGGAISANQTALLVTSATFAGNITNAGLISSSSGIAVIIDSNSFTGDFHNTASGSVTGVTNALVFSGTAFTGDVTNDGTISASGDAVRIESGTTLTGAVTNNGAITSTTNDAVVIAGTLTGTFDNTADGNIQGDHNGITIAATGSVTGGITNSGTIIATTGAAIDLSAATVAHTINQTGGLLRGGDGTTPGMATAVNMANVGVADRLNADGGVIDGNIIGGVAHTDDVIMTPDDKVVYLRGTASNIDQFDMAGAGTAILGAAARGATGTSAVGVTIGAASMTHSGSGTLYVDDNTVVTLTGAYTQNNGTLEFFLTPTVGTHGAINAATASLDGDIAAYIDPVAFAVAGGDTFTYTNVITGTRSGNFNNAADIDINSIFFEGHVVTHPSAIDIVLGRVAFTDALVLPGLTKNQMSVGDAIETIYGNGGYGADFQDLFAYLFSLPAGSEEDVQHVYDELAGAELADTQEIGLRLGHSFDNAVSGRLAGLRGSEGSSSEASLGLRRLAEADPIVASDAMPEGSTRMRGSQSYGIWAQAYGDWTNSNGDEEAAGYDEENKGVAAGADVAITRSLRAGAAVGWSNADADFDTAGDSTEIDAFHAAVYTAFETGHFYADAILSYGAQDVSTKRAIELGFGTFDALASYNATAWNAEAQTGWVADLGAVAIEPFAALRYALLSTDAFQETGAGGYNLVVASQDADSLASSLGARISGAWTGGGVRYLPSLEVAWRHEFLDDRQTILAAFEEDPTTRFQIVSSAMASDSAVVRARFGAELNRNLLVHIDYNGLYNSSANTHGATAGITATW